MGTLQAGTVTPLSAASSKLCYFMMFFFLPFSESFLFQFQALSVLFRSAFFFFFSSLPLSLSSRCFAWLCLWSRIGLGSKTVLEKETAFSTIFAFYISVANCRKAPLSWPAGSELRWESISASERNTSKPPPKKTPHHPILLPPSSSSSPS